MADQMKAIDAAPTTLEQQLQCICFNKAVDLENPQVRAGLGVAVVVGLVIFFAPLLSAVGGAAPAPPPPFSGYGGCSTADTRTALAQLTQSSKGNRGACTDRSQVPATNGDCSSSDKIVVFPFALDFDVSAEQAFCASKDFRLNHFLTDRLCQTGGGEVLRRYGRPPSQPAQQWRY